MIGVIQHPCGKWFLAVNALRVNGLLTFEYAWTGASWTTWRNGDDVILFFVSEDEARDYMKLNLSLLRSDYERMPQC